MRAVELSARCRQSELGERVDGDHDEGDDTERFRVAGRIVQIARDLRDVTLCRSKGGSCAPHR